MLNVFQGFFVLGLIVAAGYLVKRIKFDDIDLSGILARTCFFLLTPMLLVTTMAKADLSKLFHTSSLVSIMTPLIIYAAYRIIGHFRGSDPGETVIKGLSACYVNAGNVGIPIVVLALGDATAVAPILMLQLLFLAPLSFFTLDNQHQEQGATPARRAFNALTNPLVLSVFAGLILAVTGYQPTPWIWQPITLLSQCAVPVLMLSFGASLVGAKLPTKGHAMGGVAIAAAVKLIVMPALSWLLASVVFGLRGPELLAPIMTSALPTAQNVFMYSVRYETGLEHARDTVLLTTILCIPVVLGAVALFGR